MISLIGMGSGCPESLTAQGLAALQSAGLILGAKRLLEHLPAGCTDNCKAVYKPEEILACLTAQPDTDTAVLYSGDTGFYSGAAKLLPLLREVRERYPDKTIWCFTGFRLEDELLREGSYPRCEVTDGMLACIDVLVDGRFMKELKDISLQFRGSRNQRVIDMNRTRETGTVTLWDKLRR